MQLSYWEYETYFKNIDVMVIGSGIVGLNAALNLKKKSPSLNVAVVERSFLPYGASTRNAGFACFGSISELLDDLKTHSEYEVFSLVEKRFNGLHRLRQNLGDTNIGYEEKGGFEVFSKQDDTLYKNCFDKIDYFNTHLQKITGIKNVYNGSDELINQFGFANVSHLILNKAEGQIDTGKMMNTLLTKVRSMGVNIFNGVVVKNFNDNGNAVELICEDGLQIETKKLLIATNGFAKQLLPELNVEPARAQVLVTSEIPNLKINGCFHYDKGFYYFRDVGKRLLLGGGRNLDFEKEHTDEFGLTELVQNKLDQLLNEMILPGEKYTIEHRWSGIMGLGSSKTTIVKPITKNIFCSVRMGGMGIAIGSLIGEEAADMVLKN